MSDFAWTHFLHLTDTHLCDRRDGIRLFKPPYANLQRVVDYVIAHKLPLDFVVHSGDIAGGAELGKAPAYAFCEEQLSRLEVPVVYAIGNHDDPRQVKALTKNTGELLGNDPERCAYTCVKKGLRIIVLDARIGEGPQSFLPSDQIEGVSKILSLMKEKYAMVITHFQTLPIDVPWLEHDPSKGADFSMLTRNGEELHKVLVPHSSKIIGVFQGHIHAHLSWSCDGIVYYCAPSLDSNIKNWPYDKTEYRFPEETLGCNLVSYKEGKTVVRHLRVE